MPNNPVTFIESISRLREEKNLSRAELCRRANVDQSTLRRILNGTVQPTLGTMCNIANALETTIGAMFEEQQQRHATDYISGFSAALTTLESQLRVLTEAAR